RLGLDRLEIRRRNTTKSGDVNPQGFVVTSCAMRECLEAVADAVDRPAPPPEAGWRRGVGYAGMFHVAGGARIYRSDGCGAIVKVDDFGKVSLITGATEIGQGSETVLAMIVAETLGVPIARVEVVNSDTAVKPWDVGVHASRTTFIAGNAARLAAGNVSAAYGFAAQAALVEVDEATGKVTVLRLVSAHDVGRALNPLAAEGQIHGGIHMGLGYALTEELVVRDGQVLTASFMDYAL